MAATAVAVGAWANGTGRAGRRNTALLATTGAAYAWSQYHTKKKQEQRHQRLVRVASRSGRVEWVPARRERVAYVVQEREHPGRHLGWYKHHKWHKHDDDDHDD
jgi:hypothetical protein